MVNGRELHVTFTLDSGMDARKRLMTSKWESTNLHKIDESNNGDEEHEQEPSLEPSARPLEPLTQNYQSP